jgi:hypothetical protein
LVEVALQRCEGWRECRSRLSATPVCLSWGCAALRGRGPGGPGRSLVPPDPCGVSTPFGWSSSEPRPGRSRGSAPRALLLPFRDVSLQPRTAAPAPPVRRPWAGPDPQCCLSWAFVPYDTVPGRRTRCMTTDPSAAACHVRGLATPFAASTTGPPGARSAGASMGFTLQGVLLGARGAPLGAPALLTLPTAPPPEGNGAGAGRLQGLVPATNPYCRRVPERTRPSMPSWVSPLQSVLPIRPGHRL